MLSISIGPFALSVTMLITVVAISVFWAMTHWLTRKGLENAKAVDGVFSAVIVGFISARIAFVLKLWSVYQDNWWQIFNIRDGGFIPYFGWIIAILVLIASSRGKAEITKAYLRASIAAICVVIPLHLAASYYSSAVTIPQIPVRDNKGTQVKLQTFQGKPLVINYWATWCPPCRKEMPVLEAAQKQHSSVTFVFVNQGEDPMTAQHFLTSQGLDIKNVFYDPASQLSRASGAAGLPTTLFFDAAGTLIDSHMGELSNASLAHYLQLLDKNDIQNKAKP
jgi:thiol-disulfide isomerase/thioredoxin